MYAVIQTGGKQVRVAEGDVVRVERLTKEPLVKGAEVVLSEVLAVGKDDGLHLGTPLVRGRVRQGRRRPRDARTQAPRLQEEAPEAVQADCTDTGRTSSRSASRPSRPETPAEVFTMAHKKGQGSSRNGRDSNSQRLGVKRFAGQLVTGGSILVRQRGTPAEAGNERRPRQGRLALREGRRASSSFHDKGRLGRFVSVTPVPPASN